MARNQPYLFAAGAKWGDADVDRSARRAPASDWLKRSFDVAAASTILLMFLPLLTIVCAALLVQGRPLLIRQKRVGRNGQLFSCLKFRTMVVDADTVLQQHLSSNTAARDEWSASRKLKDDPRVTYLGRSLRKTSIDELPQLINVLRGEMSLVGPRPIVPAEMVYYGSNIDRYQKVRPGLTGQWQVGGRSDVSYDRRVAMDCDYVARQSFYGDMVILCKTIPAVLKSTGSY